MPQASSPAARCLSMVAGQRNEMSRNEDGGSRMEDGARTMSLNGEVALVTGSARGLGRAMAQRLAALGASVAIHDISPDACAEFGEAKDITEVATQIAATT